MHKNMGIKPLPTIAISLWNFCCSRRIRFKALYTMSKLAQEDELLIKRREHTVKKHVPAPKEPKKSQANDIEYWCRMFMSYIINGRLKYLPRIASTIGHLEPTSSSRKYSVYYLYKKSLKIRLQRRFKLKKYHQNKQNSLIIV
jgi:hypothetical protein